MSEVFKICIQLWVMLIFFPPIWIFKLCIDFKIVIIGKKGLNPSEPQLLSVWNH